MSLKQFGFDDFIDMYNDLKFSPEDTWRQKLIAFQLGNLNNSIASQRRSHLVWAMNYFDCLTTELATDIELFTFAEERYSNILNVDKVVTTMREHIQY
jgi:hypothetical protein